MRRFDLFAGAMLIGVLAAAPAAGKDGPSAAGNALGGAVQAYRAGDCAKAAPLAASAIADPGSLDGKSLSLAYDLAIDCARQAKDMAKVGDYAKRAVTLADASDFAWQLAVAVDFSAKRYAAGLDTLDRMLAAGRGGALNGFSPVYLWQIRAELNRAGDDADETRLLAMLANPAFDPDDVSAKIEDMGSYMRALYARKLLAVGKRDEARAMIADLDGYGAMSEIAFDPGMRALYGKPVDFRAVVEADLARHRAMLDRYPRALAVIDAIALDLHRLGRDDETIVLLKAALPRVATADAFDDAEEKLPWFWNALAYAYLSSGNYDAMVDAFSQGGKLKEGGLPNVSQVINLAQQQLVFGHPKEALATLGLLGAPSDASPYGLMQVRGVGGCAYAALGQLDKARAELAYAVAHENDDPTTVSALELCVGDEDAAAASYIRQLARTNDRRSAMVALADYDAPDPRTPKSPFADRFDRVRKRPDVVAAIRAAGGPLRIHLRADPF